MEDEEWAKIVAYEKAKKRVHCTFCNKFRYRSSYCKTQEKADTCVQLHPKPIPVKPEPIRVCMYCNTEFENYKIKNGHMVSCKMNPKAKERNKKIAKTRTDMTRKEETKERISTTMKESLNIKKEGDLKAVKSLQTTKNIKLKFF